MTSLAEGIYKDGYAAGRAVALIAKMAEIKVMEAEARAMEASMIEVARSVITLINKRDIMIDEVLDSRGYDPADWSEIVAKVEESRAKSAV